MEITKQEIAERLVKLGEEIFRDLAGKVDVRQAAYLLENKEEIKTAVLQVIPGEETEKGSTFRVQVDYNQTVEKMVRAVKCDYVRSDITSKNFPVAKRGNGKVDVRLVHLDRIASSEEVIRELDKMGFRPAELPELLALGAQYPNLQQEFPIVALGSVWPGPLDHRYVPTLWGLVGQRDLGLDWFEDGWDPDYRFAAVRK